MTKIACIGNSNHTMFCLARYLRDLGMDAELLVFNTDLTSFHPSGDTYNSEFFAYTKFLSWGDAWGFNVLPAESFARDLAPYDILIGCGPAPAYVHKAGRRLDIFTPFGFDLYDMPFFKFQKQFLASFGSPRRMRNMLRDWRHACAQRDGLRATRKIVAQGRHLTEFLDVLGHREDVQWQPLPVLYLPDQDALAADDLSGSIVYKEACDIRRRHDFVVMHQSRHIWASEVDRFSGKGNDILIRGFAAFAKAHAHRSPCLVTFDHGPDAAASKALVRELGIEDKVYWFRRLRRKDVMLLLRHADVATGTFRFGWWGNGAIFESLASGKPMIGNRDDDACAGLFTELYPMLQASTPAEVSAALAEVSLSPEKYAEVGRGGRDWLLEHVVRRGVQGYVDVIKELSLS